MDLAHKRKVQYYFENASLRRAIGSNNGTEEVSFFSATLSWRGLWSAKSVKGLLEADLIYKRDIKAVSSRVLVGAVLPGERSPAEHLCGTIAVHLCDGREKLWAKTIKM